MKRIRIILPALALLFASAAFGQTEKTISAMKEGTTLTDADVGFLHMVSQAALETSRGAEKSATVNGMTFKAGHSLTAKEAKSLSKAIKSFQKNYKAPEGSRGAGLCYYWYYYCDGYGYCYWYKYWYYC